MLTTGKLLTCIRQVSSANLDHNVTYHKYAVINSVIDRKSP